MGKRKGKTKKGNTTSQRQTPNIQISQSEVGQNQTSQNIIQQDDTTENQITQSLLNRNRDISGSSNPMSAQETKFPNDDFNDRLEATTLSETRIPAVSVNTWLNNDVELPSVVPLIDEPSSSKCLQKNVESSPLTTAQNEKQLPVKLTSMTITPPGFSRSEKVGTQGELLMVEVNFLPMKINIPGGTVYHYHIDFKFPSEYKENYSDRPLLIRAFEVFTKQHQHILGNPHSIVFDGLKNVYTCRQLSFPSGEFHEKVKVAKDESEEIEMIVQMKYVTSIPINDTVEEYISRGSSVSRPADALRVLDTILNMTPQLHYVSVGKKYFNPGEKSCILDISGAKSLWIGIFKSAHIGSFLMLNVDIANQLAYERCSVLDLADKVIRKASKERFERNRRQLPFAQRRKFSMLKDTDERADISLVEDELKGLKICYEGRTKGVYKVKELKRSESLSRNKFFWNNYQCNLQRSIGGRKESIYVPMELCEVKQQLCPYSKRISNEEMIENTILLPKEKKARIKDNMRAMNNYYQKDPYAKEFGINIQRTLLTIDARVLKSPILKYRNSSGKKKDTVTLEVCDGLWDMGVTKREKFKFVEGASLKAWGLLDFASLSNAERKRFIYLLKGEGDSRGLSIEVRFDYPPCVEANCRNLNDLENHFEELLRLITDKKPFSNEPQLVMVIYPGKGEGNMDFIEWTKFLGDAVFNIPTQFITKKTVLGRTHHGPDSEIIHGICLKLNSKLGGVNQAIHKLEIMNDPVMFMGGDVTQPYNMSQKPYISVVVASCDRYVSMYNTEVRLQNGGRVIKNLEEMTKRLLEKFHERTECWPEKIVFYRDNVNENEIKKVLNSELTAIKKACMYIESPVVPQYNPAIIFVVVQKRHKMFPKPRRETDGVGEPKNVPPGTVIDTVICHPTEKDFYLASHFANKGTVKPARYHVLWDDSQMSVDELQRLTYDLCHLSADCERSMSYPAPIHYSHLAGFRAKDHYNSLVNNTEHRTSKEVNKDDIRRMEENLKVPNHFM